MFLCNVQNSQSIQLHIVHHIYIIGITQHCQEKFSLQMAGLGISWIVTNLNADMPCYAIFLLSHNDAIKFSNVHNTLLIVIYSLL